nr:MAG TPA: hypothetical protein [Bacteriophage sp.]
MLFTIPVAWVYIIRNINNSSLTMLPEICG